MLTAASVFGLILGQLQEMFAVSNQRDRKMEDSIDSIFTFLQENRLVGMQRMRPIYGTVS